MNVPEFTALVWKDVQFVTNTTCTTLPWHREWEYNIRPNVKMIVTVDADVHQVLMEFRMTNTLFEPHISFANKSSIIFHYGIAGITWETLKTTLEALFYVFFPT